MDYGICWRCDEPSDDVEGYRVNTSYMELCPGCATDLCEVHGYGEVEFADLDD